MEITTETPRHRVLGDSVSLWLFTLLAFLVRLIFLYRSPAFIESNELRITLDLLSGKYFPLNDFRPYLGAINNYILALCFKVLGLHYWIPRCIPLLAGTLTVTMTFLLGRRLFNDRVGAVAAAMMSVCAYPVFFLSHVPWPNSLTPMFGMSSLVCFVLWLETQRAKFIAASALLLTLGVQSHPLVVTLAPGMVVLFALQGRRMFTFLRKPATYLVIPAAALGYANMICYFLTRRDLSRLSAGKAGRYALEHHHTLETYWTNLQSAWLLLFRLLAGSVRDRATFASYLSEPAFALCVLGFILGLIFCFTKRKIQIPLLTITAILFVSYINEAYDFYTFGRYLGFLVPLACLSTAVAISAVYEWCVPKKKELALAFLLVCVSAYIAHQISQLEYTYGRFMITGNTSEMYELVRTSVAQANGRPTVVLMDDMMNKLTPVRVYLESDGYTVEGVSGYDDREQAEPLQYWRRRIGIVEDTGRTPIEVLSSHGLASIFNTHRFDGFHGCVVDLRKPNAQVLSCFRGGPAIFSGKRRHSRRHQLPEPDDDSDEE